MSLSPVSAKKAKTTDQGSDEVCSFLYDIFTKFWVNDSLRTARYPIYKLAKLNNFACVTLSNGVFQKPFIYIETS